MKRILNIFLLSLLCIFLSSCEDEEIRIPFGYDPSFDYLAILKSSPGYTYEKTDGYPDFTYKDPEDENLVELKTLYKLDSVAGNGNELDKIFNLFNWVHKKIRHDGSYRADPENSLSILNYCQETGNGVNCVMMAIVLNEVFLSMGFPSRVIHGNGKKWIFNGEWHTYNMVYSTTLNKWIFLDPMMLAYFTDENGYLLSIAEIRQYFIKGTTLVLNENADYNGQPCNEDEYLHYLSKNIYRFSCSLESKFGNYGIFSMTGVTNKTYVNLDPKNEKHDGVGLATNYFTSNPDYFWKAP